MIKCSRGNRVQHEWNVQEKMQEYFQQKCIIIRTRIWQRNQETTNNIRLYLLNFLEDL